MEGLHIGLGVITVKVHKDALGTLVDGGHQPCLLRAVTNMGLIDAKLDDPSPLILGTRAQTPEGSLAGRANGHDVPCVAEVEFFFCSARGAVDLGPRVRENLVVGGGCIRDGGPSAFRGAARHLGPY